MSLPILSGGKKNLVYSLRDEFSSPLAAGSVNGTAAEPGPGTRALTDSGSKMSIASGGLVWTSGVGNFDPVLSLDSVARVAGRILVATLTYTASRVQIGWSTVSGGSTRRGTLEFVGTDLTVIAGDTAINPTVGAVTTSTVYTVASILRATGNHYFIKGGAFTNWTLLWVAPVDTGTPLYPSLFNVGTTTSVSVDFLRIPRRLWLPVPLASDGFPTAFGTTDGTGHAETSGLGAGGNGLAWTQALGTWGISGAAANCSVLGAGSIGVATVTTPTVNVLADVGVTRAAGSAGLVLRYTDTSNFLYAYHDGTNAALIEKVAGVDANVVAPAAATYSAGAVLRVVLDGATARLFYNNAVVGAVGTTNITTGAKHGLWTNNVGPTLDNFVVYARGNGGEYANLNRHIS